MRNNIVTKYPVTPQICRYTTLQNTNFIFVRKYDAKECHDTSEMSEFRWLYASLISEIKIEFHVCPWNE